jgi:hypothetical protein
VDQPVFAAPWIPLETAGHFMRIKIKPRSKYMTIEFTPENKRFSQHGGSDSGACYLVRGLCWWFYADPDDCW